MFSETTSKTVSYTHLDVYKRQALCRGVISSGNTNFGKAYCIAGDIIAAKLGVPHMYKFELLGTPEDVSRVREGLEQFWQKTTPTQA